MNQPVNHLHKIDILLESGTNEVEILVFSVGVYRLGINVAKVREILPAQSITQLPKMHPSVVGCFRLRDTVVPCVSLHKQLKQEYGDAANCKMILTEFNHSQMAFIVDRVERIHRLSWEKVLPVPNVVANSESPVTAVTNLDGSLVIMLDFETIASRIAFRKEWETTISNPDSVPRNQFKMIVVDDSNTIRKALHATLHNSGYTNVTSFENGRIAWDWFQDQVSSASPGNRIADIVISDVEMPSMDGFHLTRNIKQHPALRHIPVILYSSILTPDNHKKGTAVGADAQITKPELGRVVLLADEFALQILRTQEENSSVKIPPIAMDCASSSAASFVS
jgi:two-component system, chemotaxis family, chemotaxis protein CheV